MALEIIRFNGLKSKDWLIYKYPSENIIMGSQLIVQEGQVAIFSRGGAMADMFYPGTYTLKTENLPILRTLVNLPFGGNSPFSAEIYFVNTTVKLDITWGTTDPIQLVDPKYHVKLRIRAFGQMGMRVRDVSGMFREIIGGLGKDEWVRFDRIREYYRGILVVKVKSAIANAIITDGISALEIDAYLDSLSQKVKEQVEPEFIRYGFSVANFFIQSINFPDEDFDMINNILADRAAFDLMGDNRYATKRSFDVYQDAASNQNGMAGTFVAGGMGLGAAIGVGSAMGNALGNPMMQSQAGKAMGAGAEEAAAAGAAGAAVAGAEAVAEAASSKKCVSCGAEFPSKYKFCPECGFNNAEIECRGCGRMLNPGIKFCPECGTRVE
ncbi:MAG: SPFH domain-containing protein [Lachnospiraceae bacterium]|nr:SPFH domain-containing protein [Lachnospiraceae bacterium]